ncbi:hypothetical protein BS78_03G399800 [Paspalum vaginatum]|nr:hypothetical protein BS78_03G399800 [Paspalum vaginatum]
MVVCSVASGLSFGSTPKDIIATLARSASSTFSSASASTATTRSAPPSCPSTPTRGCAAPSLHVALAELRLQLACRELVRTEEVPLLLLVRRETR